MVRHLLSCHRCGSSPRMIAMVIPNDDLNHHHWMMQCSRCGDVRTPIAETRNEAVSLWTVMSS